MSTEMEWTLTSGAIPSHTVIDISEAIAFVTLQHVKPNTFSDLKIRDKPDLRSADNSTGIEVTSAIPRESHEASSIFTHLSEKGDKKRAQSIQQIQKCGGELISLPTEGGSSVDVMVGPVSLHYFDTVHKCHKAKLEKLNGGGYTEFSHQQLYIQSDIRSDDLTNQRELSKMITEASVFQKRYELIYLSVPEHVYLFDLLKQSVVDITVALEDQEAWSLEARKKVYEDECRSKKSTAAK